MKVSVIIPTHNRPQLLKQALNSVFSQEKAPYEIIVIDDASLVQATSVLQFLEYKHQKRIRVHRFESPQGANIARNYGASLAGGDILMFLDDDDTWEPSKIKDQLYVFSQNPEVGLVYSGRLIVNNVDREKILYKIFPKREGLLYPNILSCNFIGTTSSVALRKKLFEEVGGFDEQLPACQDYDLWIRCCEKTLVKHDNSCNVRYTIADQSKGQISNQADLHLKAVSFLLRKYKDKISKQATWEQRKIYASRFFAIAKAKRNEGLLTALPWLIKSFLQFPSLRSLGLIFPKFVTQLIMKILN